MVGKIGSIMPIIPRIRKKVPAMINAPLANLLLTMLFSLSAFFGFPLSFLFMITSRLDYALLLRAIVGFPSVSRIYCYLLNGAPLLKTLCAGVLRQQ